MPDTLPAHPRATDDRPPPLTADDLHWRRFLTDEVAFPEVPDHHREMDAREERAMHVAMDAGLRLAVSAAIARFGDAHYSYAADFLPVVLSQLLRDALAPAPPRSRPRKKKAVSPAVRKEVMERDAYRCQRCGGYRDLHLDHVVPESRGGGSTPANLRVLCASCNLEKGNRTDEELGW